jgi:hypothetical protein
MNPYDPESALEAIRPRLDAARARRRRSVGASAAVALFAMSSVAYAAVSSPPDSAPSMVVTDDGGATDDSSRLTLPETPHDELDVPGAPEGTTPDPTPPLEPEAAAGAVDPAPVEPPKAEPAPLPPKEATPTTEAPKPSTTTTAPAARPTTLTFTYPGTGSVTVTQTGKHLAFVSASAEPGWTHRLSHQAPDLIGVEFTKDNVQRWLKIKVVDGVAVAQQHEHVTCVPPAGQATYQAPSGSGSITVAVGQSGSLSLVSADPVEGWSAEVLADRDDLVKVAFSDGTSHVWVLVKVHDCTLKVETG